MTYLISIKTAMLIFPVIALLITIPFILHQYHKYGSINPLRVLIIYSFILYMITIYFLVILPLPNREEVFYKPNMIRLIPFSFIGDIIKESSLVISNPSTYLQALKEPCFYTVIFNIFMTIPFGMYLRYYFKYDFKKTILGSFLLSLFFEVTQITGLYFIYPYPYRIFDIDDLIINTLGGVIGYFIMGIIDNFLPTREEIDNESIEKGKIVSGLRRIVIFNLDIFIWLIGYLLISIWVNLKYLMLITWILYYIVYPCLNRGQTLGSKFLNVKLEFSNHQLLKSSLYTIFLYLYYFGIVIATFTLSEQVADILRQNNLSTVSFHFILSIGIILFYAINIIALIKNKEMFYDYLFKVKHQSTIKKEEDDSNEED